MTLAPGLYKWGTGVIIPTGVTLSGGANDVWIFQIATDLTVASGKKVILSGGAQPKNIFWQVGTQATLGTYSHFEGIILAGTLIAMQTGASINGSLFAQTAVTLDANTVTGQTGEPFFPGSMKTSKQDILSDLTALRAGVTNKYDGQKLDEAIKHLTKSLTDSWWMDDTHLQAKEGAKVFNEEKDAVNQLRVQLKDPKSLISDVTLQGFIDRIVKADLDLALVAIADTTGNPKDIAKANEELHKGITDAVRGNYESAIEHYRNAWKFASK
jgi:hypothetical protein